MQLVYYTFIGDNSASVLLSVIGNWKNLADEDKLAACMGVVPRGKDFNETIRYGLITKHGSTLARTMWVQCAFVANRCSPCLRNYDERIKRTRGNGRAIIATARKLLGTIYKPLTNG